MLWPRPCSKLREIAATGTYRDMARLAERDARLPLQQWRHVASGLLVSEDARGRLADGAGREAADLSLHGRRQPDRGKVYIWPWMATPQARGDHACGRARHRPACWAKARPRSCERGRRMAWLRPRHRRGRHVALFRLWSLARPRRPCRCAGAALGCLRGAEGLVEHAG